MRSGSLEWAHDARGMAWASAHRNREAAHHRWWLHQRPVQSVHVHGIQWPIVESSAKLPVAGESGIIIKLYQGSDKGGEVVQWHLVGTKRNA